MREEGYQNTSEPPLPSGKVTPVRGLQLFVLKMAPAKARIWPWLAYRCRSGSKNVAECAGGTILDFTRRNCKKIQDVEYLSGTPRLGISTFGVYCEKSTFAIAPRSILGGAGGEVSRDVPGPRAARYRQGLLFFFITLESGDE